MFGLYIVVSILPVAISVFSSLSDLIGHWNTVCRFRNMLVLFPSDKCIWVMSSFILTAPGIAYKLSEDKFLLILR